MFIPCRDYCYLRFNKQYTKECNNTCDYARIVKVLKEVLITESCCIDTCKNFISKDLCNQYEIPWQCDNEECKNHSLYEIDWNKIYERYDIKFEENT